MTAPPSTASARPHIAARLEQAVTRATAAVARRRGWQPRLIPYTGYGTTAWVRVLGRVLLVPPSSPAPPAGPHGDAGGRPSPIDDGGSQQPITAQRQESPRGWRRFVTTQLPDTEVHCVIDGREYRLCTDRGGYFDAVLPNRLEPGWHDIVLRVGSGESTVTRVFVLADDERWGVVSDIDDTVLVTHLPRPLLAAWNTFVQRESARVAVTGMADLYRRLLAEHPGAPVIYLSTGAWNVAPTLTRFLSRHGFPEGPLLLTDWGPTNTGWFRSGQAHKRAALRRLTDDMPHVRWLLIGDDGQHDPAIYAEFARTAADRVRAIAIRELTATQHLLSGHVPDRKAPGSPVLRVSAPDGYGLARDFVAAGLLDEAARSHPADESRG